MSYNSGTKYQNRSSGGWPLPKSDDLHQILYRIKSAAHHGASYIVSRFFSVILHVRSLDRGENCTREWRQMRRSSRGESKCTSISGTNRQHRVLVGTGTLRLSLSRDPDTRVLITLFLEHLPTRRRRRRWRSKPDVSHETSDALLTWNLKRNLCIRSRNLRLLIVLLTWRKKNNSLNCEGEEEEKEGSAHHSKQNKMFEVFHSDIMLNAQK
jgi:hypothetical protein